ncbi:endonuclease domain-containing protein [Nesterenkonia sp. HG001]|uniref:endonuclease domain-containing protein n=1 Tax=Nesterenkonia sp. HG001 TaxID=2983207 RepID=UPI002AC3AF82|nr:DUF559 domain-containing protein [Nesterenkonia sp. HG001]MDZ5079048.1 endonuclease domain-containing protein [Nesterenkonia sp. HG001]
MASIPRELRSRAFTTATAASFGLPRSRLQHRDVVSLGAGVYVHRELAERLSPEARLRLTGQALLQDASQAWLSHTTAATLQDLWLPGHLEGDPQLHLSAPGPVRMRRRGVLGHRVRARPRDILQGPGIRMSSPARTWLDLAPQCTDRQLVMLGDHLVRRPYRHYEMRDEPHATVEELRDLLDDARGVPGRRRSLRALEQVRVGADSVQETRLRLAILEAGLPEPALQVPADPTDRWSPCADLGYPELMIAIQYDGGVHYTPERHRADQHRDNAFLSRGWDVLRFHVEDHRDDFHRAVGQIRMVVNRRLTGG